MVASTSQNLQLILIVIGGLGLLLAAWGLFQAGRRRRSAARAPAEAGWSRMQAVLEPFRSEYPAFYHVAECIASLPGSSELLSNGDVRAALRLLENRGEARRRQRPDRKRDLLGLTAAQGTADHRVEAAMLTLVRSAYFEPALRDQLPETVKHDLDGLLDALTAN